MTAKVNFGPFTLDTDRRQLFGCDGAVHLTPKAYDLLKLLLNERPRAVSKAEIHEHLWPSTFVEEATLARLVADLRAALGTAGQDDRYIRTVHGFGYAFDADASVEPDGEGPGPIQATSWTWLETDNGDRRFPLREGANQVGRSASAQVCVDDATVSRRHARIIVSTPGATIEDLGSRNGTLVNDVAAATPATLRDGDEVKVGSVRLRFRTLREPGSTTVSPERESD